MRRVVTGDDIAQVRNPDPFAPPAWRSPVYRTPLWIVAIVHFVRMLVWLVRFLFRHPVLVLAAIVGVLMWRVTGHPSAGPVAGLALPAPLGRGDDYRPPRSGLPGPGAATGAGQGFGNPFHRPGAGPARVRPVGG
jgi:hypothetical protein